MTTCAPTRRQLCEDGFPPVVLPGRHNYIGVFLTLDCTLRCSYCINRFGGLRPATRMLTGAEWVHGLNRIVSRPDLPITLQGGEPTLHPDFYGIVRGIRPDLTIDVLTNLEFDPDRFMSQIPPGRLRREAPYASIRVSYHPERMRIEPLARTVLALQNAGYSIGIWGVLHPRWETAIRDAQEYCRARGMDFRTKEFLGEHEGALHGRFTYPDACDRRGRTRVRCRTTELLIGPDGGVYRCHADLYEGREAVGHILDPDLFLDAGFRPCGNYGHCNPCDVKLKTDRFQTFGHTSVEILADAGAPSLSGADPAGPSVKK